MESRAAEERHYREWYEHNRSSTDRLSAIVSTTFACNLDCTYCCQSDVLDGTTIKPEVALATAEWFAHRALEIGARELHIDFVGGEPLLHPQRIDLIVERLREILGERVRLTFGLITNGMFMTRELVERWKPLGLTWAQVTLDGDETTHSHTRRSKKKGEDSFALIFANVVAAAPLIKVTVSGNYQTDTVSGFVPLLGKLRDAGFPQDGRVHFSPALAALGAPSDAASGACTWSGSSPELMIALSDEVRRHGFDPGDLGVVGPCGFHQRHYYAVDPQGHIYKCPGFLGKPEWAIGHVQTGLGPRYERLANINPQRLCGSCAHRPECGGGCVAAAWIAAGRVEGVNCEIGYYERHRDDIVKRKYALATHEGDPVTALADFPAWAYGTSGTTGTSSPPPPSFERDLVQIRPRSHSTLRSAG